MKNWLKSLWKQDERKATRYDLPHLIAYHSNGSTSPPVGNVRDVSRTGLYLLTKERWYPGTQVMISLQRSDVPDTDPSRSITVNAKVVRLGSDGIGLELTSPEPPTGSGTKAAHTGGADLIAFGEYLKSMRGIRSADDDIASDDTGESSDESPGSAAGSQ